jgi:hypothetical protein
MNRKLYMALMLVAAFALSAIVPPTTTASAQGGETKTVTITEAQINELYRVTNPRRQTITNVSVDVQEGQVAIAATITTRPRRGVPAATYNTLSTFTPEIKNGALTWNLASATVNGQPVSQDVLNVINASIFPAWRNVIQRILAARIVGPFQVTGVTVGGDAVTITYVTY